MEKDTWLMSHDVISINDFSKQKIKEVIEVANQMVPIAKGERKSNELAGKVLATLFFEPSTRTRLSFETAMHRLGGSVVGFSTPKAVSIAKGESLADTIRMVEAYADVLVLRHPNEGAARLAAEFSSKPVINAGDGAGQHPTQTLLDLFTIKDEKGKIGGNNIVLVGDLKYGRTVHSLVYALARFEARLTFVSPPTLPMPPEILSDLHKSGTRYKESDNLKEVVEEADVLYVTRIQRERFPDPEEYRKIAGTYRVDLEVLKHAKNDLKIMHPLPRVHEIAPEVDSTPYACYFKQAFNGIPLRMALLKLLLSEWK